MKYTLLRSFGWFELIYFLIVLSDITSTHHLPLLRLFTNPLLVASLIIYYKVIRHSPYDCRITVALLCSLIGDVIMMFDYSIFFKIGIICFSIAHIAYALAIKKMITILRNVNYIGIAIMSVYYISLIVIYTITPHIDSYYPFLVMYSTAQSLMVIASLAQNKSYLLVIGAIVFVFSDLLLAAYKFHIFQFNNSITIMITYALAQYLIVRSLSDHYAFVKKKY